MEWRQNPQSYRTLRLVLYLYSERSSNRIEEKLDVIHYEGCNGFVRKPIDIDELPKQVAEHIACASSTD